MPKTFELEKPRKASFLWEKEKELFKKSAIKYQPLFPENCAYYTSA